MDDSSVSKYREIGDALTYIDKHLRCGESYVYSSSYGRSPDFRNDGYTRSSGLNKCAAEKTSFGL